MNDERNGADIQFVASVIYRVQTQAPVTIAREVLDAMEDAGLYRPRGTRAWRRPFHWVRWKCNK